MELDRVDDDSRDESLFKELIVNDAIKIESALSQMEQWSILSNVINYVQYSKNPKDFHTMTVRPVNNKKLNLVSKDKNKDDISLRVDLKDIPIGLKEEYLDRYEGAISEMLNTTRFDENSDLSTTYLGELRMTQGDNLNVVERFPTIKQGYTVGKLLDSTESQILLDTGASKSFMSKSHYLHCKSLHSLPKFASKTQRIQVANGQYVSILFVIPIIVIISGHIFEIYTLVSKIHENIDLVLGIKNMFELEGIISLQECYFGFLNRSVPILPKERIILKLKEQKLVKIDASFSDEISGLAIMRLLDKPTQSVIML